jgi:serine/threonine protein kinase
MDDDASREGSGVLGVPEGVLGAPELSAWVIGRELGRGGMGVVHHATERATGAEYAIKFMIPRQTPSSDGDALVRREIDNCLVLDHPHIVRGFSGGRAGTAFFLVMELCRNGSLDQAIARHGPLDAERAIPLILDVLAGLEHAHRVPIRVALKNESVTVKGVVHRDIKPENIFLTPDGRAKVGDFGLAKAFQTAGLSGVTRSGMVAGTPSFMPRQQVLDFKYATPAVDVWATAALLYWSLTGATPRDFVPGRDPWLTIWHTDSVPIGKRGRPVPGPLARLLDEALRDDRDLAYTSAGAFAAALEEARSRS